MYARTPALIALTLPLLTVAALGRPAQARREIPSIRGSYFGNFYSNDGDIWQSDMTLSFQTTRRVSGQLSVAASIRGMVVSGAYSGAGRITLTGRAPRTQRPLRLKLQGKVTPEPDQRRITINGTYTTTGSVRESGTFELVGYNNDHQEF